MSNEHPITPPPELVQQWLTEGRHQDYWSANENAIVQAAKWGADQELEACVEWLTPRGWAVALHEARRPKPPSLAEQALAKTEAILNDPSRVLLTEEREALELNRRALKRLKELEQQENNDN